jgi:hypothetical protein
MDRTWFVLAFIGVLTVAWYFSFTASRLDRLHHRVEGARATLDAQLVRRAEAAVELATSGLLDPASGLLVAGAASDALAAGEAESAPEGADPAGRETAESDLSHALDQALDDETVGVARGSELGDQLLDRLESAGHRVQLGRRFHNQAVTDAQRVRRKRVVRWFRLAGRAAMPQTFEMDDELPEALSGR